MARAGYSRTFSLNKLAEKSLISSTAFGGPTATKYAVGDWGLSWFFKQDPSPISSTWIQVSGDTLTINCPSEFSLSSCTFDFVGINKVTGQTLQMPLIISVLNKPDDDNHRWTRCPVCDGLYYISRDVRNSFMNEDTFKCEDCGALIGWPFPKLENGD